MNPSSFRPRCRWSRRLGTLVAVLLVASFDAGAQGQSAVAQGDMPAGIYAGACTDPNPEPVHRLTDVRLSGGVTGDAADDDDDDVQAGQAGGIGGALVEPVAFSDTEIDDRIDALTQQPHVVIIWDSAEPNRVLACGQIGGFPVKDDDLAFGLTEQTDSGYHGIAILDDEDDDNEVEIALYLAGSGAMASDGTGSAGTSDTLAGEDDDGDDTGGRADAGDDLGGDDVNDDDAGDAGDADDDG